MSDAHPVEALSMISILSMVNLSTKWRYLGPVRSST